MGVLEYCGRFNGVLQPGCACFLPCNNVVRSVSLRLHQQDCRIVSKTKDNVFVQLCLTLQYQVIPDKVEDFCYKSVRPAQLMVDQVMNSIRAKIPLYKLEALYVERGTISQQLKNEVDGIMASYGVEIVSALITDIEPGPEITNAMNDIQRLQRLRVAAVDEAETKKMQRVRAAEANCEARKLAGEGLAEQRKAIVAGLMQSIEGVREEVKGLSSEEATNMLLMNQYYDTLQAIAAGSKSSVMVLESTGGLERIANQLKQGVAQLMK